MRKTTIILLIVCLAGFSLLVYPSFSNYWNSIHTSHAINNYVDALGTIGDDASKLAKEAASAYNDALKERVNPFSLTPELQTRYAETLDVTGTGIMGFVEIDKIGVSLPLYHGTSEGVLQVALGHVEWTYLPVGGEGTHCVVSGHRGLPTAKLFSDLDRMREGDTFTVTVLDEVLTYEVDQIRTILPGQTEDLVAEEGKDLFTLVTCTPYGINTHRLLVRGHRIASATVGATVISEAVLVDQLIVAFYLGVPLIFILFMGVMLKRPPKKKPSITTVKEISLK